MAPGTPPDPNNPAAQPIQKPPDPKAQQAQQQLQLEQAKAQTDAAHEQAKAQADMAIAQQKFEFEKQIKTMDMAIATEKHQHEMHLSTTKMLMDGAKPGPDGQPAPEHPMVAPMAALTEQLKVANAPKHIIRTRWARWSPWRTWATGSWASCSTTCARSTVQSALCAMRTARLWGSSRWCIDRTLPSPAGLTRGSIFLRRRMDCRVKPGNDERSI